MLDSTVIEGLSKEGFASFADHLREAHASGRDEDINRAVAEALWNQEEANDRIGYVTEVIIDLLRDDAKEKNVEKGGLLMRMLFYLSMSLSQDQLRVRRSEEGASCALILGFAGSHVDELERQAEFYNSVGLTAISMTGCMGPAALSQRQTAKLANELRMALTGGGRLHVHICSNHGMGWWISCMSSWKREQAPFDSLPPLEARLASMVFECAPMDAIDPKTGEVMPMPGSPALSDVAADNRPDQATAKQVEEEGTGMAKMVMIRSIAGLVQRFAPSVEWEQLVLKERMLLEFMRFSLQTESSHGTDFVKWELMDVAIRPAVPRLFLYSAEDSLFRPEIIEAYVRQTARYNPDARVSSYKCKVSAHCKLWETENKVCARLTSALLRGAKLIGTR